MTTTLVRTDDCGKGQGNPHQRGEIYVFFLISRSDQLPAVHLAPAKTNIVPKDFKKKSRATRITIPICEKTESLGQSLC